MNMVLPRRALAVLVLTSLGALAACGGSSDGDTTGSVDFTPVDAPLTSPPTEIRDLGELPRTPEPGKTVGFISSGLPMFAYYGDQFREAVSEFGWDVKVFTYTDEPAAAVTQAISAGVDYIYGESLPEAQVEAQLAAAHDAGIPVLNQGTAVASDPENSFYTFFTDASDDAIAASNWIINDSEGAANVVHVTMNVAPLLAALTEPVKDAYAACEGCTVDTLDVTPAEIGSGAVATILATYLQSHPDVNYVHAQFADLMANVVPTLKSSGLADKVKLVVGNGDQATFKEIANGGIAAATAFPNGAMAWGAADMLARIDTDPDSLTDKVLSSGAVIGGVSDPWIVTDKDTAAELGDLQFGWPGPDGYQDQYKKLWKIG